LFRDTRRSRKKSGERRVSYVSDVNGFVGTNPVPKRHMLTWGAHVERAVDRCRYSRRKLRDSCRGVPAVRPYTLIAAVGVNFLENRC